MKRPRSRPVPWLSALTAVAALLFAVPGVGSYASSGSSGLSLADRVVIAYQSQFLDPQSLGSTHSGLPADDSANLTAKSTDVRLPPKVGGQWAYLSPFPAAFNAIHAITGPNGKILLMAGSGDNINTFRAGSFTSFVWDPATGERRQINTPDDLFCSGHVLLPDGRALIGGGTAGYAPFRGSNTLYAFNFYTETYQKLSHLDVARWYPGTVTGADGRVLFSSGFDANGQLTNTTESYDPVSGADVLVPSRLSLPLYPHIHLAANGKFYNALLGTKGSGTGFWDPYANTFQPVGGVAGPTLTESTAASCFVGDVRDQNLMVLGGGWPATKVTTVVNLAAPKPAKIAGPLLPTAKAYVGCVNLPDGTLLEANGGTQNTIADASTEASILPSTDGKWTPVNPLPSGQQRLYHSMLFLMDDGRVISMTSNPQNQSRSQSLLAYSPPYLFKGTRPVWTAAPDEVTYGGTYSVAATTSSSVFTRVSVTTPASLTHSMDNNQRYLSLPVTNGQITLPTNPAILPPGWYRMWAADSLGRVSVAHWFHLSGTTQGASANAMACCCCGVHANCVVTPATQCS